MREVYSWFSVRMFLQHFIIVTHVNISFIRETPRNVFPKTTVLVDLEATIILQYIVTICLVAEGCTNPWLHA